MRTTLEEWRADGTFQFGNGLRNHRLGSRQPFGRPPHCAACGHGAENFKLAQLDAVTLRRCSQDGHIRRECVYAQFELYWNDPLMQAGFWRPSNMVCQWIP